ncbi:hypothetical protein ACO0QE_003537 [Hanseniaspora vineae]
MTRYVKDGSSSPLLENPTQSFKNNETARNIDELNAEILYLKYQVSRITHESDIKEGKHATEVNTLTKKYQEKVNELDDVLNAFEMMKQDNDALSKKLASLDEHTRENKTVEEHHQHNVSLLEGKNSALQNQLFDLTAEREQLELKFKEREIELQSLEDMLRNRDTELQHKLEEQNILKLENSKLEKLVADYRASGQSEESSNHDQSSSNPASNVHVKELEYLKKELQTQLEYSRELESENLKQSLELKSIKQKKENVDFLTRENNMLRSKLAKHEDDLKQQLEQLHSENDSLKSELLNNDVKLKYDALVKEVGLLKEQHINWKEEHVSLERKCADLKTENEQLSSMKVDFESAIYNLQKLIQELEQQKQLAFEESRLLRQELDDFLASSSLAAQGNPNNETNWNGMVDKYKNQSEDLTQELKRVNEELKNSVTNSAKKRKFEESEMMEKETKQMENTIALEHHVSTLENTIISLESERSVLHDELQELRNTKELKIRILQLRDSPLNKDQFVKRKMLQLLKKENEQLLSISLNDHSIENFPKSVYHRLVLEQDNLKLELYNSKKQIKRLKEMFNNKSAEFVESVNQILGYKLEFLPGSKVKLISCYDPTKSLEIDLVKNTLKSSLSKHLPDWDRLLQQWVVEKKEIPGLLATIQLQLYAMKNQS